MEPRIAIYARVSTTAQDHDSQHAELKEYCVRRGWSNVRWFSDTASGVKRDRVGLAELMDQVRRGKVDVVLAFKLDRFARSLSHLAQVIAELQTQRVALVVPSQGIDTSNSNPAAQLQLNILAAVAQFERELITERVNAGIVAARGRGVVFGRPTTRQKHVDEIKACLALGLTAAEISRKLKIPSSTAREIVKGLRDERSLLGGNDRLAKN